MDEIDAYTQYLKDNMEYDVLISNASPSDRRMIDEMLDLMLETIVVKREYIRIGAADYPYTLVKSRLMKVDYGCIQYVLKCMKENTTKVRNIKAYLITALYNAPGTIDNYYQAEYNHDRDSGEVDYFLLWILVGCPFGIKKMWAWLVPSGFDLSGTVGVLALNFILGGLIGGFVVIVRIIQAIYNIFWCILWCIAKEPDKVTE